MCCCSFGKGVPPGVALRAAACIVLRAGSLWQLPNLSRSTIVKTHVRRVTFAWSPVTGSAALPSWLHWVQLLQLCQEDAYAGVAQVISKYNPGACLLAVR